ncbi:hypothetical protein FSP39_008060 [Pinctada imbricata]|uniref:Uncharacterized protein n=1 Tax=Pinctada imbricata TaxID=66713 RepID=A0AA89BLW4_PINIB|nr:hypothetical protein FSP39_008060 [Pinctada imbricata]
MASKGLSYSTVTCYLAGISFNLKLNNFTDPCQFFIVQKMLLGLKRTKNVKDVRSPITLPLLNQLLNALPHVCHNYYEYILFAAAYCLAFFALLRVGEITLTNAQTSYDPLRLENIVLEPSHLTINILRSKTDQAGKGKDSIWIVGSSIVARAKSYCQMNSPGLNLSLECKGVTVIWRGVGGMKWANFEDNIRKLLAEFDPPKIIVIHCGGNSIGELPLKQLQISMKFVLGRLHRQLNGTLSVWSYILPRFYWRSMLSSSAADVARNRVNSSIGAFVRNQLDGAVIRYPDIKTSQGKLFCDSVHLSK